jgi:hypothetical protein
MNLRNLLYPAPEKFNTFNTFSLLPTPSVAAWFKMPMTLGRANIMRIFEDDDVSYLAWVEGNRHVYVVNTCHKPDPRYLILHQANCYTILGRPARGDRWTTGEFMKACARTRTDLDQWARRVAGSELQLCGLCRPD